MKMWNQNLKNLESHGSGSPKTSKTAKTPRKAPRNAKKCQEPERLPQIAKKQGGGGDSPPWGLSIK